MALIRIDVRPAHYSSGFQEVVIVSIIMVVQALNAAGSLQTLPMLTTIQSSFPDASSNDLSWLMAAFPLTAGTFILISGKFGDMYGLKKVFLCGALWSIFSTLITGISFYTRNVIFFCICRGLYGIGMSFMLPNGIGIMGNIYPNGQRKALVFCLIAASAPTGAFLSCLFSGIFAHFDINRWSFYTNCLVLAVIFIVAWFYLPDIPSHHETEDVERPHMDWIGAIIGVVGLVLFNFAWNQAPQAGWSSPYIIVLLIVGLLSIISFFFYERRVKDPLLPTEALNSTIGLILATVGLGWASFSVWSFYFWSFILKLKGYTPIQGGLTYITFFVFGLAAAFVVAIAIRNIRSSYLLIGAASAFFIGITMLSRTPVHQSYFTMLFPQMMLLSFGMDMSFPSASLIMSDHLPKRHQGMASSLVSTTTNYAMSIGLGIAATAENKILKKTGDELQADRAAMYVGVGFAALGLLLSFLLHLLSYVDQEKAAHDEGSLDETTTEKNNPV